MSSLEQRSSCEPAVLVQIGWVPASHGTRTLPCVRWSIVHQTRESGRDGLEANGPPRRVARRRPNEFAVPRIHVGLLKLGAWMSNKQKAARLRARSDGYVGCGEIFYVQGTTVFDD